MAFSQHFKRGTSGSETTTPQPTSSYFWLLLVTNFVLSAASITLLGLISSMVAWLHIQKQDVKSYNIAWPATSFDMNVLPKNLWVDQGHTSNGVAGYGFFLGLFGMVTAWRLKKSTRPLKSITALAVLHFLAVLFTLSAFIFVFIVTYRTTGQSIRVPIAANNQGKDWFEDDWTPENWFQAVLDLPIAEQSVRDDISASVTRMVAWRWLLLPIFNINIIAFCATVVAWLRQRKNAATRVNSANSIAIEK